MNKPETPIEFIERRFVDANGNIQWNDQVKNYLSQKIESVPAEDSLFYLAELVRTISRVANKFPAALTEDDLNRLTQAQSILNKYPADKSQIPTRSAPIEESTAPIFNKDPINFLLVNALRVLDKDKMQILTKSLAERCGLIASAPIGETEAGKEVEAMAERIVARFSRFLKEDGLDYTDNLKAQLFNLVQAASLQPPSLETGKHKPFIVANIREIIDLYFKDEPEISFSRMVEMLNEIAAKYYSEQPPPMQGDGKGRTEITDIG